MNLNTGFSSQVCDFFFSIHFIIMPSCSCNLSSFKAYSHLELLKYYFLCYLPIQKCSHLVGFSSFVDLAIQSSFQTCPTFSPVSSSCSGLAVVPHGRNSLSQYSLPSVPSSLLLVWFIFTADTPPSSSPKNSCSNPL